MLILALVTVLAHMWELHGEFVYDDLIYIVENEAFKDDTGHWLRFLLDPYLYGTTTGHYRPLVAMSYAANLAMGWGTFGFKVTQLLLHLGTVLGFMWLLTQLRRRVSGLPVAIPLVGALLAAILPFNVEAVHYLTARSSVMCGLFSVWSVAAFLAMRGATAVGPRIGWYLFHLVALVAAVTSKETGLALPLLILCTDLILVCPGRPRIRADWRFWVPYLPYGVGLLVALPIMPNVQRVPSYLWQVFHDDGRLPAALQAVVEAVRLVLLPTHLSVSHPITIAARWTDLATLLAVLVWLAMLGGVIRGWRRRPLLAYGLTWFLVMISPSTFVHLHEIFQENRGYTASFGLLIGLCWGLSWLWQTAPLRRRQLSVLMLLVASCYLAITVTYQQVWATQKGLWLHAGTVNPGDWRVSHNLAFAYEDLGQDHHALEQWRRLLTLQPDYVDGWIGLGSLLRRMGRPGAAIGIYRQALALDPQDGRSWNGLGIALQQTGDLFAAEEAFHEATLRVPEGGDGWNNLGVLLASNGRLKEARQVFLRAAQVDELPDGVFRNLVRVDAVLGYCAEAAKAFATGQKSGELVASDSAIQPLRQLMFRRCPDHPLAPPVDE